METHFVVTGVVKHKGKILILKKSKDDYNYPNKWSFCSGFVKEYDSGEATVIREIKEETGLDAKIVKTGNIVEVLDEEKGKKWVVAVYLCSVDEDSVKLCHENVEFKWVLASELKDYGFVPGLSKDLKSLGISD